MQRPFKLLMLLSFITAGLTAQHRPAVNMKSIGSIDSGHGTTYYVNKNEPPRAIEFGEHAVSYLQFASNINQYFDIPAEFTFKEIESNTDDLGIRHRLMQQYYKGIPLEGLGYRIHERNGLVTSVNGKAVREITTDTKVRLTEAQALKLALHYLNSQDTTARKGTLLLVSKDFAFSPASFSMAYQFEIIVSFIEQWRVSISATTGELIKKVSLNQSCFHEDAPPPLPYETGTGLTNYYGPQTICVEKQGYGSRMVGQTENGGIIGTYDFRNANVISLLWFFEFSKVYDFYSANNIYNTPYDKPAVSVQWAAEQAYEYFFNEHNRNSFDNNGAAITSYVHVGQNMDNALWLGAYKIMAFGDGSNGNPIVELDAVSHELAHGITQYEAALEYYFESGALNESFSDIFGKAVEFHTFGDSATWMVARRHTPGGFRDMSNPNSKNQPDTYYGDMWFTGFEDNGGVHYNSGVQNFWFYLLCKGGTGVNDQKRSYSVNPIGIDKAVKIAYRNLGEYLIWSSDYLDSRIGSLLATADLYGKNSDEYQEVVNAWNAVGVIMEPIITHLELYDITATTVKIKGNLLPRGNTPSYHFEYGTTADFGSTSAVYPFTDKVEATISGLQSETKYYLRLVATNENGSSFSTIEFTTISLSPLVELKQTVDITETSAVLYGKINPNSLATSFYFEYGLTPELGLVTAEYSLSGATEYQNVSAPITNLQPRQNYYFRLVADNRFSTTTTESLSLYTATKPIISSFSPVAAPPGTQVIITGNNFNPVASKNVVSFGATKSNVVAFTAGQITVEVPDGASLAPIALLDIESGLQAESVQDFVPTFDGEFKKDNLQLRYAINELAVFDVFAHDMDGDGKPDLVSPTAQGFSVFLNTTNGGGINDQSFVRYNHPVPDMAGILCLADLDGNGLKDVIILYNGGGFRIYPNQSVPGYIFFGIPVSVPVAGLMQFIATDIDQDGHIDIAAVHIGNGGQKLTLFRNQNSGTRILSENFVPSYHKSLPIFVENFFSDDLNNDGLPELLFSNGDEQRIPILKNSSRPGMFDFEELSVLQPIRSRFARYHSTDFNQDGLKDIISSSTFGNESVTVFENKTRTTELQLDGAEVILHDVNAPTIQSGDINGDGKVDLVAGSGAGRFSLIQNVHQPGQRLSASSFEHFHEYGLGFLSTGSGTIDPRIAVNDLNGDGRPDIIIAKTLNFWPYDGYFLEIWQNSTDDCLDPSSIGLTVSRYSAEILLPENTTLDDFEMEFKFPYSYIWTELSSATLSNLSPGTTYRIRVRAKCSLAFTDYHEIQFTTECIDTKSFSVINVGHNWATVYANELDLLEVEYKQKSRDTWMSLPRYANNINNLSPGTTYQLRYRGRCNDLNEFSFLEFTTVCPPLTDVTVFGITSDSANVTWYGSDLPVARVEYSSDRVSWTAVDEQGRMNSLTPQTTYHVRATALCADNESTFIFTSFTTLCPSLSSIYVDQLTATGVRVSWDDQSETRQYELTYSRSTGGSVVSVMTNSHSYTLTDLNPGTHYVVNVAPVCSAAKQFSSITFTTACYPLSNLTVNVLSPTSAELAWSDETARGPYVIEYTLRGSNKWITEKVSSTEGKIRQLRPGSEYEVRVQVACPNELARYLSVFFETDVFGEISYVPNPTDGMVTIYPVKDLIGSRYSIYDNTGRQVAHGELRDYTLDLTFSPNGIYILKIEGEKPVKLIRH